MWVWSSVVSSESYISTVFALSLCLTIGVFASAACRVAQAEEPNDNVSGETDSIIWDKGRRGWQVGAKLLSATGKLQSGDPVVVQFVLRNVSNQERTVGLQQYEYTFPTLGEDNRINLNITGSSKPGHRYILAPGETLEKRQYRVTVSTEGLLPGLYEVTAQPAFWQSNQGEPQLGTGIGREVPVRFTLGDPDSVSFTQPPYDDDPKTRIHWGKPVGGLVVGMRLPQGRTSWSVDSRIENEMFIRNVSSHPIEFEYEIPGTTDWNMHVVDKDGEHVRLDWVWYTGFTPRVTRSLKLAPTEQSPLTSIAAEVQTEGLAPVGLRPKSETRKITGPTLLVLAEKTEFRPGDPKRLITTQGTFKWSASITVRQASVPDVTMVIGSTPVQFKIQAESAN
jgi:hypothetical protein